MNMKKKFIRTISIFVMCCLLLVPITAHAEEAGQAEINTRAKSAILMCTDTGDILYEQNSHERLHPASVTKVMSLLLIMEAVEGGKLSLTDMVTASRDAAAKGGSQIWLKEGEAMSVSDMLKAICVASANDACAAMAEKIAGSEEGFVKLMNARAQELGMLDTHFENCTGLDDTATEHLTSAYDIAIMSRELIQHDLIREFSTIWMDTLRDGATELTNTNRLIRFYEGATGLKTGTTEKAGSCLSATATKEGLSLVAVVMGCATSDDRFEGAKALLNHGFANYALYHPKVDDALLTEIKVVGGVKKSIAPCAQKVGPILIKKGMENTIEQTVALPEEINAPIEEGQALGEIDLKSGDESIAKIKLVSEESVEKTSFLFIVRQMFQLLVS